MAGLGDILAGAATGKDPDYEGIEASAALKGAQFNDTMAQVPLRGAQTKEALANADKARLEAIALQRKQDEIDHLSENLAAGGVANAPTLGHLVAAGQPFNTATEGLGHDQEQGLIRTLSDPHADPQARLAASSGLTHKLESPFAKLDAETVNVTDPTLPGGAPNEHLSQIGEATIGQKGAAAGLANAKAAQITSTNDSIDPNEIAYHAALANADSSYHPSFGMGQSELRKLFFKAQYLVASNIPVTAETLGIDPSKVAHGFVPPSAIAPAPPPAMTAGGGGENTPNNPLDHQVPVSAPNPADNAPAGGGPAVAVPTSAVIPAPAPAPAPAPLSPTEAASNTAGQRLDSKASTLAASQASKMLGIVQAQAYKAHNSFARALGFAHELAKQRGPDGSPLINQAFLDWKNGVTGNPLTAQFVHEITVAHEEYGKIISGATGAAGITDAGRKQADKLFGEHMNSDTLDALGPLMDKDANDARMGFVNTINAARAGVAHPGSHGLAGQPGADAVAPGATPKADAPAIPPAAAASLKEGHETTFGNKQVWTLRNGQPVRVR